MDGSDGTPHFDSHVCTSDTAHAALIGGQMDLNGNFFGKKILDSASAEFRCEKPTIDLEAGDYVCEGGSMRFKAVVSGCMPGALSSTVQLLHGDEVLDTKDFNNAVFSTTVTAGMGGQTLTIKAYYKANACCPSEKKEVYVEVLKLKDPRCSMRGKMPNGEPCFMYEPGCTCETQ
jgi:hypothetical protein